MAFCANCGTIINKEDIAKHICDPANIPIKGKELQPQNLAVDVQ